MAPLKTAALALGSLALTQASATGNPAQLTGKTEEVLKWLNLYRNAKIDVQLPDLQKLSADKLVTSDDIIKTPARERAQCTIQPDASSKALLLEVPSDLNGNYGKLLDSALTLALPDLLERAKTTRSGTSKEELALGSLVFLSSQDPTHVGCSVTTDCDKTYLLCKFAKEATPSSSFLDQSKVVVTQAFAQAVEARKNANIKIADLKETDAKTPLTSGVAKVGLSALAVLAVALPSLLF